MGPSCPRCATPLDRFQRHRGDVLVDLDECPRCHGVWVDGAEIADVSPELAKLRRTAREGRSSIQCPRCSARAIEVPFFELLLDFCLSCHGVWLDGDERVRLVREVERAESDGTYRGAVMAVRQRTAPCAACRALVPLNETYVASDGAICAKCHAVREEVDSELSLPPPIDVGGALSRFAAFVEEATDPHCRECGMVHPRH